jgi:hypothetical protein
MHAQKLEFLSKAMLDFPDAGLAFGQAQNMSAEGKVKQGPGDNYECYPLERALVSADRAFDLLVSNGYKYGGAGGIMLRKEVWSNVGKFDPCQPVSWDYDFALRMTLSGFPVAYCPVTVFYHRWRSGSLSGSHQGLRVITGWIRAKLRCFKHPKLSPEARAALVSSLQREGRDFGYWDRIMGDYSTAISNNLTAAVHLPHKTSSLICAAKTCLVFLADLFCDQLLPSYRRPWRPEMKRRVDWDQLRVDCEPN